MALPITFSDFVKYIGTPIAPYILPIIPVGSTLTKLSKISPGQLGKIPGMWKPNDGAWTGYPAWQDFHAYSNATALRRFQVAIRGWSGGCPDRPQHAEDHRDRPGHRG